MHLLKLKPTDMELKLESYKKKISEQKRNFRDIQKVLNKYVIFAN